MREWGGDAVVVGGRQRGGVEVFGPGVVAAAGIDELREERDGGDGEHEAQAAAEDGGGEDGEEGGGGVGGGAARADGGERDAVAGDDEEEGDHGARAEDDAEAGQLEEGGVRVGREALPALEEGPDEVPEEVVERDDEGGQPAHAVDPGVGRDVGGLFAPEGTREGWTWWAQGLQLLPVHGTERESREKCCRMGLRTAPKKEGERSFGCASGRDSFLQLLHALLSCRDRIYHYESIGM